MDGREAIYDINGNLLTDNLNGGTYNYASISPWTGDVKMWVGTRVDHFVLDVVPYYVFGDGPNDPTNIFERVLGYYYEFPQLSQGECENE